MFKIHINHLGGKACQNICTFISYFKKKTHTHTHTHQVFTGLTSFHAPLLGKETKRLRVKALHMHHQLFSNRF
jgi:hypothetical protein